MLEEKVTYAENKLFEYNKKKKIVEGIVMILGAFILVSVGLTIYIYSDSNFWMIRLISGVLDHIATNVVAGTLLGATYVSTIGGLFFVIMPNEILFMNAIKNNSWVIVTLITLTGFFVSYSINYFVGQKLSGAAKKIITPKKFYKTKGIINKWGKWAIFGINALPLPSQPLAAILGVFNYNRTRFYVFFLTGQLVKAIGLTIITLYMV